MANGRDDQSTLRLPRQLPIAASRTAPHAYCPRAPWSAATVGSVPGGAHRADTRAAGRRQIQLRVLACAYALDALIELVQGGGGPLATG